MRSLLGGGKLLRALWHKWCNGGPEPDAEFSDALDEALSRAQDRERRLEYLTEKADVLLHGHRRQR